MVLTTRLKVLFAVAAAIGIYIVVSRPDPGATTAAPASSAARGEADTLPASATHGTARGSNPDHGNPRTRPAHRAASSKTFASFFPTQSRHGAAPPPPPAPLVAVGPPPP